MCAPGSSVGRSRCRNRRGWWADPGAHRHWRWGPPLSSPEPATTKHISNISLKLRLNKIKSRTAGVCSLTQKKSSFMQMANLLRRSLNVRTGEKESSETQRPTPASWPQSSSCRSKGVWQKNTHDTTQLNQWCNQRASAPSNGPRRQRYCQMVTLMLLLTSFILVIYKDRYFNI